jgi:CubicO group peptidase (beta-lactamase class C family)
MVEAELAPSPDLFPHSPDEFMKRLGNLPLIHQPGENWMYHTGLDVLGVLIARAADMSFGNFLEQRIFAPLGMKDTGFSVPEAKLDRLATCYRVDPATGKLVVWDEARGGHWSQPPIFEAGGGGLVSTADDYFAFARMMLDHGMREQKRILARRSVDAMITDQITPAQKIASPFYPGFWDTRGWGFGLAMTTAPDNISKVPGRYGWDGGYGTTYIADPHEDLVVILLTQRVAQGPDDFAINQETVKLAYQAIA